MVLPLIVAPLAGAILLLSAARNSRERYTIGMVATLIPLIHTLTLILGWEDGSGDILPGEVYGLGLDGLSLALCGLTTFLAPITLLSTWRSIHSRRGDAVALLLVTEAILLLTFLATDMILFYVAFEGSLLPLLLLVGGWGGRGERVGAAQLLVLYTLAGGLPTLAGVLSLVSESGSPLWSEIYSSPPSPERQTVLVPLILAGILVKVPVVPLHLWLPQAHVEAPTAGSVLLAGVILKLGGFAILRWVLPLLPEGVEAWRPLLLTVATVGTIWGSLGALGQSDMKRIVAYSSVAHMNLGLVGTFSGTLPGIVGSILLMVSHGLVSSALFLTVGVLYDRYGTRTVAYYRGMGVVMPLLTATFLLLTLANVAFPGTSSFPSELSSLVGGGAVNPLVLVVASLSIVLGPCYALSLYHRVSHGSLSSHVGRIAGDLSLREFHTLLPLLAMILVLGVYPSPVVSAVTLGAAVPLTEGLP